MVAPIMRLVAAMVAILAALASCGPTTHPKPARSLVLGEFEGVLPCADCAGLDTKLTLVESRTGAGAGTYIMSEDYIGKSSKPFESSGNWNTVKGTSRAPSATVYVLDPDKPRKTSYYALRDDGSLQLLDRERNEIDAPFDLFLKPRSMSLTNPAATNCAHQGGRSEIRRNPSGGQYGVCLFADGRVCEEWAFFRDGSCVAPKP